MKRTRVSLKDILQEDSRAELSETQPENFKAKKENNKVKTEEQEHIEAKSLQENKEDNRNNISEIRYSKSEYVKMSITLEPNLFDAVDELSRKRRKRKLPYSYSEIVREALKEYFGKNIS